MEYNYNTENIDENTSHGISAPENNESLSPVSLYEKKLNGFSLALEYATSFAKQYEQKYKCAFEELDRKSHGRIFKIVNFIYGIWNFILPEGSFRYRAVRKAYRVLIKKPIHALKKLSPNTGDSTCPLKDVKRIDILTVKHTKFIAEMLKAALNKIGIEGNIITEEPDKYKDIPYIILAPQMFSHLPKQYIVYQMEQTVSPRWMNERYFDILSNACAVMDYSLININCLRSNPALSDKIFYVPLDYFKNPDLNEATSEKEYDILLYGDMSSRRRAAFLSAIPKKYNVKIIRDSFGEALYNEMRKAKVIVNVHYYEKALLETCRIYETLSVCDAIIVSERSYDITEEAPLENIVDFAPINDFKLIIDKAIYWVEHDAERLAKIENNKKLLNEHSNAFDFYFNRFLLANEMIDFEYFYSNYADFVKVTDRICLNLPENTVRRYGFEMDNNSGFKVVPGLRHNVGWIGCGMSYKFLLRRAADAKLDNVIICEDDVLFPTDFSERFKTVQKYLSENKDWDIFSGMMADIGNIDISKCVDFENEDFVYINHIISMVFNWYNKSSFDILEDWVPDKDDVLHSTIDRFLQKKSLKIITTHPFLVGHKEFCHSTIWGQSNSIYSQMIAESEAKLNKLIEAFKNKNSK